MIRVLTLIDMDGPVTTYEVTRVGNTDQWCMTRLDIEHADSKTETVPGEHLHTGTLDEVLRLVRITMAKTNDVVCSGCDCPLDKCGPKLWTLGRKCCPDCEHA